MRNTELILFFVIVDIEPKLISDGEVLLFNLHASLHGLPPFDGLLDNLVNVVHVYPCFSNQVVEPDQVAIPDLNSKDVRVHVLGLWRIVHRELEPIVEVALRSAGPVRVSLLRLRSADNPAHEYIVGLHLNVFVDTVIGGVDNDPEFVLVKGRRMYLMGRSGDPLFFLN